MFENVGLHEPIWKSRCMVRADKLFSEPSHRLPCTQTNKQEIHFLPLKRKKNWSKTYLPALVIIISVSSRWNISQSSLFRRRTVMVLCSPSIFVLLAVWILPLEPWKSLLVFEFRSCASVFSCKVLTRVECISTLSAHVSMGSVEIGVFVLSRWSGDFELNSCAIFWLFFDAKNNQCRSFSTIPIKFSSSRQRLAWVSDMKCAPLRASRV